MLDYNKLLPQIIRRIVTDKEFDFKQIPYTMTIEAGVLFTDVTGFTKMTELVSQAGYYSIEIITQLLNKYFDEMYKCIHAYKGDLIKYGGDSILAIFPGQEAESYILMKACLWEMKANLKKLNKQFIKTHALEVDFHCNMSWGEVKVNLVGDAKYHLDYFITGKAVEDLFSAGDCTLDFKLDTKVISKEVESLNADNNLLKLFFPERVKEWLETNKFKGELKNSALLFVKVENTDNQQLEIPINEYNHFYKELQEIVYFYEGTVNKIDFTDKGYLILITFGVPYLHNDDIERAFICSLKISQLPHNNLKTKIGLNYNNIFSGVLGAKNRYEYGIVGNAVNISARLMSEAPENDFAFSSEIAPHIQGRYETEFLNKVKVKGIAAEIEIYHVTNELSDFWNAYLTSYENTKLIGYTEILKELENSFFTCIYGGIGSGKSHLIYEILAPKIREKLSFSLFVLSEYDKLKPLTIFYKIINKQVATDNIVKDYALIEKFIKDKDIKLDFQIVVDYFKEESLEIKAQNSSLVYDLITEILTVVLKEVETIVIENLQWADSQSLKVLIKLIPKLLSKQKRLIFTANNAEIFNDFKFFSPTLVTMKDFDENMVREFFQNEELAITHKALSEILTLSQNNPAYIKEIREIIKVNWSNTQGVFDLSDLDHLVRSGKLPKSFEIALLNDFESLDNDVKQLLKYASIMGVSFSEQLVDIFSEEFILEHIETMLAKLTNNRHIFKKLIMPEIEYFFNNSLMRDAIYRTILLKEKQKLHLVIANYYLKSFSANLYIYYEVIANHFILAKAKSKSVKWCSLAAHKNFELSAYGTSDYYYTQALSFCGEVRKRNEILMALVAVNVAQNKAPEIALYLDQIKLDFLTQAQSDLYYFYKIRLSEIQKDFELFKQTYQEAKELIKSEEVLLRIKLVSFDYYRMNNSQELFNALREELGNNIESFDVTSKILYFSILGQYYLDRAEYSLAEDNYLKLNHLASQNKKKLYLRISATSLGIIQIRRGNQEKGLEYFQKALILAEDIGDKHGYAKVSTEIAMVYFAQGNDDQALATLTNCLQVAKYIGDKQQEQTVLYNFGYIYSILQEYQTAIQYLQEARDIAVLIDDKVGFAFANDGIGDAYFQLGQFVEAKKLYEANLQLQELLQDKEGVAHTIGNLANIYREEKNYPKALELYNIQQTSLHEIGDKIGEGKALFNWGMTLEILKDKEEALIKLKAAYQLFINANDKNYSDFVKTQIERIQLAKASV